jgi:hypothetical protein
MVNWPKFKAIDAAIQDEGWKVVFLLRLSPLIPFNLLNYFLGLTPVRIFPDYFLATFVGMLPGCAMFVYIGSTLGAVADVVKGNVDGGGECTDKTSGKTLKFTRDACESGCHNWEEDDTSAVRLVLMVVGLIATIVATVFVTVVAKKKLNAFVEKEDETPEAHKEQGTSELTKLDPPKVAFDAETAPALHKTLQKDADEEVPAHVPVVHGAAPRWQIYGGCIGGWLLLIGAFAGLIVALLYKAEIDAEMPGTDAANDIGEPFWTAAHVKNLIDSGQAPIILDARDKTTHGVLPGAQKTHWKQFAQGGGSNNGQLLGVSELQVKLKSRGVRSDRPVVIYGDWANEGAWGEEGRIFCKAWRNPVAAVRCVPPHSILT